MSAPAKYSFSGYHCEHEDDEHAVAIPELDALLNELDALLAKHDVKFSIEGGYDESPRLVLERYTADCLEDYAADLHEASDYIPWIARARREWQAKVSAGAVALEAQRRAHQEAKDKLDREQDAIVGQVESKLLREGLTIGGEKYRLVKVED